MKTKSLRFFREKYMTDVRCIKHVDEYDIQYIGGLKKLPSNIVAKGFFDLSHGDKENVDGFLSNFLKIAEDNQAIYEFLQNAADCGSTLFYLFYDEDYFLAVNNGVVFNKSGLRSILNVAQSDKHDSENIGRFGIGFKLVHRLVGVGDGLEELTKEYKGPILFSWNRKEDLLELMKGEKVEPVNEISDESPLPYLCKLIITNFPAEVGEVGKDLDYNERIFFTQEEYMELSEQVNKTLSPYLSTDNFNHGSLFFIKLGKGKKEKLDVDYNQNLKTGIEYSLNTLRKLSNVKINGSQIIKVPLILQSNTVEKGTDTFNNINPEYKDYDIHYVIGYNEIDFNAENPFINVDALKKSPTFYKYFPLGDEIHQSAIFIHSDSLSNETNRRKLHEDTTNKYLLSEIAGFIINNLEHFKKEGKDYDFLQLYANLLLCDKPHDNSIWLKSVLYDIILEYLTNCIPTDDGYANCAQNVKIKNVSCSVPLSVVNKDYEWFRWNGLNVKILVDAAKDKLSLDVYDIIDIIENSNVEELNKWILTTDGNSYESFLNEINSSTKILSKNKKFCDKLVDIKMFKFNGTFRSYNDIICLKTGTTDKFNYIPDSQNYIIFTTDKIIGVKSEMVKMGFVMSDLNIDNYPNIKDCFKFPDDVSLFDIIAEKVKLDTLSFDDKKNLFLHLISDDESIKFSGVGTEKIKSLELFRNNANIKVPLSQLIGVGYKVPEFLNDYKVCDDDSFKELKGYTMPEKDIYKNIILKKWDDIAILEEDVENFYKEIIRLYNIDGNSNPLKEEDLKFIYTENKTFVSPSGVFYNDKAIDENINYKNYSNAIENVFNKQVPNKKVITLLNQKPFSMVSSMLTKLTPQNKGVVAEDIKTLLQLCEKNKESFFKAFLIRNNNKEYFVENISQEYNQIYTKDSEIKSYIRKNFADIMVPLPNTFDAYNMSEGIIRGDTLYKLILTNTEDINNEKENLVKILKYDSRRDFILRLNEIRCDLGKNISVSDFEYKIMNLASDVINNDEDLEAFRSKFVIVHKEKIYHYNDFNRIKVDNFSVEGALASFDMAKILPEEHGCDSLITDVVKRLVNLGVDKEKLNNLLGFTIKVNVKDIFNKLISKYTILDNAQQLAFIIAYCNKNEETTFPDISLKSVNGEISSEACYVSNCDFIDDKYVLAGQYSDLGKYISLPNGIFSRSPYINDNNEFVCLGINTNDDEGNIDYNKVISLLNYLLKCQICNRSILNGIDWNEFKDSLGFIPANCILTPKLALESEKLPDEVQSWCEDLKSTFKKNMLSEMGVLKEDDAIIEFRHYMSDDCEDFDYLKLIGYSNLLFLENSLEWLSKKDIYPLDNSKYNALTTLVDVLNRLRENDKDPVTLSENIDFDELYNSSIEYSGSVYNAWKEETGYSIYIYGNDMPKNITMNEYIEGIIYEFNEGVVTTNNKNIIYVKDEENLQNELLQLSTSENSPITTEQVYKLFNRDISELTSEIEKLRDENAKLRSSLENSKDSAYMSAHRNSDLPQDERPEYNELARKKVMRRLIDEGYVFQYGIGEGSIVRGVLAPDGNPVKLIVKSCRRGTLSINPSEWAELLYPDAMLWCYDGHDTHPLYLRQLIRNQDELLIRIDTCNLDDIAKISELAKVLKYFKQIHFDFNSVRPTNIAETYKDYAFDDRAKDEKPQADEFE